MLLSPIVYWRGVSIKANMNIDKKQKDEIVFSCIAKFLCGKFITSKVTQKEKVNTSNIKYKFKAVHIKPYTTAYSNIF